MSIEIERWASKRFQYVLRDNVASIYLSRKDMDQLHADIAQILWEDDALDRASRIEN